MAIVADLNAVHSDVIRIMRDLYGDRLNKIILYGSYARGDFHDESDIDYLVVLNDTNVSAFREVATIAPALYKAFSDSEIDVSVFAVSKQQLMTSTLFFYRQVRKDGICIYERPCAHFCHPDVGGIFGDR
ncbi:nucleotidyltransferase-like protein [Spirosoma oryzae]|uniref:Nucleotidyltransferase-like protein n=2 Tax=Spirosoma oryzae TaxID=1469603 RepID=A0A2T0TIC8_9BACT|nr:nucleotidyltransferase-like protein [Spirosoma oryzae]